jgi:FecR protein
MSATPCPRLFEAEAVRDGRLAGPERTSFERHVTVCPACSREVDALEALAGSLRADRAAADELHVRRERTRLLAAFDSALLAPRWSWNAGHRLLWSAAAAALVVAILVLPQVRRPADAPAHASSVVVHADSTAVWTEHMVGERENVVLDRGALWIHVDHSSRDGRLLVVLPDGELEDIGTTFMVSAEDGRTTRVAVQEGHVVLRLRSQAPIALGPGDTWTPDPRPAASARASVVPSADPAPTTRIDRAERRTPPPRSSASSAASLASDPSVDFRAAMAALDVGDNHQAAAAFADFLEKHPRDPRSEDAAYLRVVALQRSGDSAGMKQAALEYLHCYPAGFRQAEVEPLSR